MNQDKKKIGIVTAPGYTKRIGEGLYYSLPGLLREYVDEGETWEVESLESPLTGYTEEPEEVLEALLEKKQMQGWDMAVCLTDLPLFRGKKLIVAEANSAKRVGLLSLPGLGAAPLIKRIRESILQLLSEMHHGSSYEDRDRVQLRVGRKGRKKINARELVKRRGIDRFSPIVRENSESEKVSEVRFTVDSRLRGALRLITGMVRANRPWRLFEQFLKILAVAFTTGAFGFIIFSTLWEVSIQYSFWRMIMINIFAIVLLVFWIMTAHKLWERKSDHSSAYIRRLYNSTTVMTLLTAVSFYYTLLLICFQLLVLLLLPTGAINSQLNAEMNTIGYFYIAWTATSISTIVGALGTTMEDEDVVLSGTYGNRQRQRYELINEAEQEKKEAAKEKEEAMQEKKEARKNG
ncbi:hypothetical protein [Salimicrobium humidisoli]|uniref:5,10-methylene-tetrahydrofolate dehydrogenase n=1 Tax=Salimicrobium humidisoli TaxID=2029857 RepID=A0ABX4HUL6_9BACI|nr:hypothetical protein [Salimicrobium humidisoli]PBB06176.1 hypothetical protein CKW00_05320 [Salimicrobium humidisoli]